MDFDDLYLVPADFELPPRCDLVCPCGVLEQCRCDGLGIDREPNLEVE